MAILAVEEIWNGRTGELNERGIRTYARVFRVQMSNHNADALECTNTVAIPGIFAYYESPNGAKDFGSVCRTVTPVQEEEDPNRWVVTCRFSSERIEWQSGDDPHQFGGFGGGGLETGDPSEANPLLQAPDIEYNSDKYREAIEEDLSDPPLACTASNGEKFDPPVERDATRRTLTITRNEVLFPFDTAEAYEDSVNSTTWVAPGGVSVGPGLAKCDAITGKYVIGRGSFYCSVTYRFSFRKDGWLSRRLNQGSFYISTVTNKSRTVLDEGTGAPMHGPFPLGDDGELATGIPPDWDYTYREFVLYPQMNFNALGLPT